MSERAAEAALRAWGRAGGALRITVRGWSMAPLLHPGDIITVLSCAPGSAEPGAILVVRQGPGLLTHRYVRPAGGALILWGDALPRPDPPVPARALVGRVVARERGGRLLSLEGRPWEALGLAMAQPSLRAIARPALAVAIALIEGEPRR